MSISTLAGCDTGIKIAKKKERRQYRQSSKSTHSQYVAKLTDTVEVCVPQPKSHIRFLIMMIVCMILGLFLTLVINALLTQGSFQIQNLNLMQTELQKTELVLQQDIIELETPSRLAHEAIRVGMIPNGKIVYIDLATRKIVGLEKETSDDIFSTKELLSIKKE